MGFPRQEYWSGLPFSSAGSLPDPGIESRSPALQADSTPSEPPGKPIFNAILRCKSNKTFQIFMLKTVIKEDLNKWRNITCSWMEDNTVKVSNTPQIDTLCVLVAQSCPTLCHPMDCSPPGSSIYGIFQVRILERVAMPSSRGSSQLRDRIQVSCTAGRFFTIWATRAAHSNCLINISY